MILQGSRKSFAQNLGAFGLFAKVEILQPQTQVALELLQCSMKNKMDTLNDGIFTMLGPLLDIELLHRKT